MEEVLYHATYGEYINSIKEKGLGKKFIKSYII